MKQFLYRLSCLLLLTVAVVGKSHALLWYADPQYHKICPGDVVTVDVRQTVVWKDTVLYDTAYVAATLPKQDTVVTAHFVNVYPTYIKDEPTRYINRGGEPLNWHGKMISKAGTYDTIMPTIHGCDSIFRVNIRERVVVYVPKTLCAGNSFTFGTQTITDAGTYTDTMRMGLFDSITVMTVNIVKPDTVVTTSRIREGEHVTWEGDNYYETGVYDKVTPNRFKCDSVNRLILTVYHVDTLDTTASICPSTTITWHGQTFGQTGTWKYSSTRPNGDEIYCILRLTVRKVQEIEESFRLCDGESVTFNGATYSDAGTYYNQLSCDTIVKVLVTKNPSTIHIENGVLNALGEYYWQYELNGNTKIDTLDTEGTYVHESISPETGCKDIWRLILTKDVTTYNFKEELTICENQPFSWRGRENLNRQGIGTTLNYYDKYKTVAGNDSIYELKLTVNPVPRTTQMKKFCGSIEWSGTTYEESAIVVDTFVSVRYLCDSIVTTFLSKGVPFHSHDTATIVPGETLSWRDKTITTDGLYTVKYTSSYGCDSIYSIGVGLIAAPPQTKMRTWHVSICEGESYKWLDKYYTTSGLYTDTLKTLGGEVDSIFVLDLKVNESYHWTERVKFAYFPATYRNTLFTAPGHQDVKYQASTGCDSIVTVYADRELVKDEISATICHGDKYTWRGHEYKETYRYVEIEKAVDGIHDSIEHILNLYVHYIPETHINKTICKGDSYTFGDKTLTTSGVFRFTFHEGECDSVVVLSLTVLNPDTNIFVHHIEAGDHFDWNGEYYEETGTYFHRTTNRFGCDSVNVLELTVNQVDTVDTTAVVCPNAVPFYWHGISASQTGMHYKSVKQADGSYVYYRLNLQVRQIAYIDTTFTICSDASVSYNGKTYATSGEFRDYIACDTVVRIRINKLPQTVHATQASLGGEHGYTWHFKRGTNVEKDSTFYIPNTYEFEYKPNDESCSELWRLILTKDETEYKFNEVLTICEGDDFTWHGLGDLSHLGIGSWSSYEAKYQTRAGKDSIYTLRLFVNPARRVTQTIPFCTSYTYNGKEYTESATVVDTLKTINGCDSIVTTKLVKGLSFHRHDTATIHPGETLYWRDKVITSDGLFSVTYPSSYGCDSTYSIGVGLIEAAPQTKMRSWNITICENDTPFVWRGKNYTVQGIYVDTIYKPLILPKEMDSLYVLNLTVNKSYHFTERVSFHSFPVTYRGHLFEKAGKHDFILSSTLGCDSIITVYADSAVNRTVEYAKICYGEEYLWSWDGNKYSESGTYVMKVKDHTGLKDSVEHVLNLTVKVIPDTYITKTICKGGSYTFGDHTYTESVDATYTFLSGSCDSVVHLSLNVVNPDTNIVVRHRNPDDPPINWNGQNYTETGTYFNYGTNRFGCDSVNVLILTVNHVDTIDTVASICPNTEIYWHGIHASQTGDFSGAEQQADGSFNFYRLHLTVRTIKEVDKYFSICGDESVTYNGKTYTQGGVFRDYIACDTMVVLHITKQPQSVYETRASLGGDHGYTWHFKRGTNVEKDSTFYIPNTYEFEYKKDEQSCPELWRLILTKDENEYHFEETLTICEGDDFTWHGQGNLSHQYIGEEHDYEAKYKTRNGKDSVYTLHLTVKPKKTSFRTVTFCGETVYNGKVITSSTQILDTVVSSIGCDSIITINFDKANSYYFKEHKDLPQGKIYHWHGIDVMTDGVYTDSYTSKYGCDSIYELTVKIIPATPQTNQYAEERSICAGDSTFWRKSWRFAGGTYVDTVKKDGKIDSIFTLTLTVHPSYYTPIVRHLYNCNSNGVIYYLGEQFTRDTMVVDTFSTVHGCDSVEHVYMHFGQTVQNYDTVRIASNKLPYVWSPTSDTTINVMTQGVHVYEKPGTGGCTNRWELYVEIYNVFYHEDSVAVCETNLPYYWLTGPTEHQGEALRGPAGQTTLITYAYTTVHGADSTYLLKLHILPKVEHIEQIWLCEGDAITLNGKTYVNLKADSTYRDTISFPNPNVNGCDSIVYYEIKQHSALSKTETKILHEGEESITWRGTPITAPGQYHEVVPGVAAGGCDSTYYLNVIKEQREVVYRCIFETPYKWEVNSETYSTTGLWTDTAFDANGNITEFHTLELYVNVPIDKDTVLRGCLPGGVTWNDVTYYKDTIFRDTLITCDTMYTVKITVDTTYMYIIHDTICEHDLPYVVGFAKKDSIYTEGWSPTFTYKTACGCDSIVQIHLTIRPDFDFDTSDSMFVCEDKIDNEPVILGDTVHPAFDPYRLKVNEWRGKWKGVQIGRDSIVYNCDSTKWMHVIVRPHQALIPEYKYTLCEGDSVQLFWPHKDTWIKEPGEYYDTIPTISPWTDVAHGGVVHNDRQFECDSIFKYLVLLVDTVHVDTTVHIAMGDSLMFGGQWRYMTGVYDSIGEAPDMDSAHHYCKYVKTLYLYVDSTYYYRDTLELCDFPKKEMFYTWKDGHDSKVFTLPTKDSTFHVYDSLLTVPYRFDSVYDLYVNYKQKYYLIIRDTLCYGDSIQFDKHSFATENNNVEERYLKKAGIYVDTLTAKNYCDSIIELRLEVRDRIDTVRKTDFIVDRNLPYLWSHTWYNQESKKDTTSHDTLWTTGEYRYLMPSIHGCDSMEILNLNVHETHVFKDTINICAPKERTLTHIWEETNYEQSFTTPKHTIDTTYEDTLVTRIPLDSIYHLFVRYHVIDSTIIYNNICEGDSLRFGLTKSSTPRFLKDPGVYRDTMTSDVNGCDSIVVMYLNVYPKGLYHQEVDIADVDTPFIWPHQWYENGSLQKDTDTISISGHYSKFLKTIHGCDSIDSLTLRIHQTYNIQLPGITICESDTDNFPYSWEDKTEIRTTGDYTFKTQTHDGYDSIRTVHITILPILYDTIRARICEGDSLRFGLKIDGSPFFVFKDSVYRDTLKSYQFGCDSIVTLYLNVWPKYYHDSVRHIADVDTPFVWIHKQGGTEIARDSLYSTGVYGYRYESKYGCDSIDSLHLFIHKTYKIYDDTINICSNDVPYAWRGLDNITATGNYLWGEQTVEGYDSVHYVHIHVWPQLFDTIRASICEGSYYSYQGNNLTKAGIYRDTTQGANGCDKFTTLILTVNQPYNRTIKETILEGSYYVFYGDTIRETRTINHAARTPEGCDSTTILQLTVHPKVDTIITVCDNELPYSWMNKWNGNEELFYTAGLHRFDTIINGEKHFYGIDFRVNKQVFDTIRASICEGSYYTYQGNNLTEPGIYRDTTQGTNGCDKYTTLILSVNQPYQQTIKETILEGSYYVFYGDTIRETKTINHAARTPEGCDSITILELKVHPKVDTVITVCDNELPYGWTNKWNGNEEQFYTAGLHRFDTIINGEKYFYGVDFRVNKQVFDTIRYAMCEGSSYSFMGQALTEPGIYRDTTPGTNGCDKITTLLLTVNKPYKQTIKETILEGCYYVFYGDTIRETKTINHAARTPEGCDSITILELKVHPKVDTVITVCDNDLPYGWTNKWNGNEELFYSAGLHRFDTIINGEKYFYGVDFRVNKQVFDTTRVSICEGNKYVFNSVELTEAGIYRDTLGGTNGCDSIHTLILTVNKAYYREIVEDVLEGQQVEFFGNTYSTSGTYKHFNHTPEGCDSTTILTLRVHPMFDSIAYTCFNQLPYVWYNRWSGKKEVYYSPGIIRNDTTINGEKRFFGLKLEVNRETYDTINAAVCQGESYAFGPLTCMESGTYNYTITGTNGCDSIRTLILTVKPQPTVVVKKSIYRGDTIEFENQKFAEPGTYEFTRKAKNAEGCDTIVELQLTVNNIYDDSVTVCYNELPYKWQLKSDPTKYMEIYKSAVYRDTIYDSNGEMAVTGIKVTVLPIITDGKVVNKTICEGDIYTFGLTKAGIPRTLTEGGTYYDTVTSSIGCDSIVKLVLTVQPVVYQTETQTIFEGDSIEFPKLSGKFKKEAGIYEHREPIPGSVCFDNYQLILKVVKPLKLDTTAYVCENELPYRWRDKDYQEAGDYTLPITWTDTSRVTVTLHLKINKAPRLEQHINLCSGDTFTYKGMRFYESGDFYDTIPTNGGCDSIIRYIVRVHPTSDRTIIKHVSDKEPFIWHGRTLTISGVYEHTDHTHIYGCDSTEHLILTVHPSFLETDSVDLCKSDTLNYPYKWHGQTIEESGTYWDSTLTVYGFDSVYKLVITVHQSYLIEEQYEIGTGEVLKIHGRDISKPAIYYDTLRTIHGCDSVFHIVINQKRTKEFTWNYEICQSDPKQYPYEFFGRKLTHTGTYTYTNIYKDSVVTLNLTVNPSSVSEKRIVIADTKNYYTYDGKLYENLHLGDNLFADTLNNQYGCDSIKRLIICVTKHYSAWTPVPLCPGSEVKIDGQVITESGLYTFVRRSRVTGEMDSLYRVEVYDAPAYEYDIARTICEGDTLFFKDSAIVITRGGHHDVVLKTKEGCDSVFHLDLTVNPSYHFYNIVTTRDFEPVIWMGKSYFTTGIYNRSYPTVLDCDSTYTLDLRVVETLRDTVTETICTGQSITWRGKQYDVDGYYTDTVWRPEANFSAIYSLRLVVAYPTTITSARTGDICADAESFDIYFEYNGHKPTYYSVYFDQLAKREGFEDVINAPFGADMIAHVKLPQFASVAYQGHPYYVRPDYYTVRLALDNGVCGINRSDSLRLLVKYPSWILEQNWTDVVAPLKAAYNGGYEFSQMEWYINDVKQPNTTLGYLQNSSLIPGDQVVMMATRRGESVAIPTCPLVIQSPVAPTYETPVIVYPTQAPKHMPNITVEAPQEGTYEIYSSTGLLIESGKLEEGKTTVTLPAINGIYFIRTYQGRDAESHKVILY